MCGSTRTLWWWGPGFPAWSAPRRLTTPGGRCLILDQEPEASLGGQAHWSFGGLFLVDSPEQRHLGVKDSAELALGDWMGSAAFDRPEDVWPRRWAEAYVNFAAGEKRAWLHALGVRFFPLVQWAERGGYDAQGHGNSVPRFHVVWGTGPGILAPFLAKLAEGVAAGRVQFAFRHRATELMFDAGTVTGVRGQRLARPPRRAERGEQPRGGRRFECRRRGRYCDDGRDWRQPPHGPGAVARRHRAPVHAHGRPGLGGWAFPAGCGRRRRRAINTDRMWHYPEGIHNPDPVWPNHGIRILSGPSPLWLDATGQPAAGPALSRL